MHWRNYFTSTILDRGKRYYKKGLVQDIKEDHGRYTAVVVGSIPYTTSVLKKANKQLGMSCSCPFAQDGKKCKHMAALCMELDELLVNGQIAEQPPAHKKSVMRVYPFTKKNIPGSREYVCFDLSVITDDLVIMSDQLEKAQKMIDSDKIRLNSVTCGHSKNHYGEVFATGKAFAYLYTGDRVSQIELYFSETKILQAYCSVPSCHTAYYGDDYGYSRKKICVHELAVLLLLEDYIDRYNPGDTSDYQALQMLQNYQKHSRTKTFSEPEKVLEDLSLEPRVEENSYGLTLSFRAGVSKLYVVKDLDEFIENVDSGQSQTFGKSTVIDFSLHKPDQKSRPYYDFLRKAVTEEQLRCQIYYQENSYHIADVSGSQILLYGHKLDELFQLIIKSPGKVSYRNRFSEKKEQTLTVATVDPDIQLNIEPVLSKNQIFQGIRVNGFLPQIFQGESNGYYITDSCLCRIPEETFHALTPLLNACDSDELNLFIGRKMLAEFYYHTMPLLEPYVSFQELQPELIEKYLPSMAKFQFYLDTDKEKIFCQAKVVYGEISYPLSFQDSSRQRQAHLRDIHAEDDALYRIQKYFETEDVKNEMFFSEADDAVYTLLQDGISDLMMIGEVFCTDRLKNLNLHKKLKASIGVSIKSGIMEIDISSTELSSKELLDILSSYRKKKKYHRLSNGDFIRADNEDIELLSSMLDTLKISSKEFLKGNMKIPAYRALYLDKLLEQNESFYVNRDKNFKNLIREFKTLTDSDYEVPASLRSVMRSYQVTGFQWLKLLGDYGFGGILADDMGLGKTLQIISLLLSAKEEGKYGTSLIITPASLIYNWQEEFTRFAPSLQVAVISGTQAERSRQLECFADYDVLITSYDLLKRDIAEYEGKTFLYQVIDEAQYIKNHTTMVAKSVKCIQSAVRYALTGTPIENRLSELWSIFDYLMPGFLYGYEVFRKEFETPIIKDREDAASARLKKMVAPFILRRMKQDVLKELPEKLEEIFYAKFSEEQQKLYDGQVVHMKELLNKQSSEDFSKNKLQILSELTRIRQICCDPSLLFDDYHGESTKRETCMELIRRAIEGEHRILLFSQFTSMLQLLEDALLKENISYFKITGSTKKEERVRLVKEFNDGTVPVFLISLKAGGTGLNLTGADTVIHYDPWWNLAVQNQATDRAHRIGQKNIVTVYRLIVKNSIEEKIVKLQESKKDLADEILNGENGNLSSLSKEDLLALLQ